MRLSEGIQGPKLAMTPKELVSTGWSGTAVCDDHVNRLRVRVLSPPNQYSNELHVTLSGVSWRIAQVAAFLDDGNVYSSYGVLAAKTGIKWREVGSIVEVLIEGVTGRFSVNGTLVHTFSMPPGNQPYSLGARVHPHGALVIVT